MNKRSVHSLPNVLASLVASLPILVFSINSTIDIANAEVSGLGFQSPQEREIFNTSPGSDDPNSVFEVTNPLELMNKLRRMTAMDDATSPSDAIDAALEALELDLTSNK